MTNVYDLSYFLQIQICHFILPQNYKFLLFYFPNVIEDGRVFLPKQTPPYKPLVL